MKLTDAQLNAIHIQACYYDDPACPCEGLVSYRVTMGDESDYDLAPGEAAAAFHYLPEGNSERTPAGLEVTIFAACGKVVCSQDFG